MTEAESGDKIPWKPWTPYSDLLQEIPVTQIKGGRITDQGSRNVRKPDIKQTARCENGTEMGLSKTEAMVGEADTFLLCRVCCLKE
jgi:hypothetical protein